MRVLILSCNTGGGHDSAGNALREVFGQAGIACEMRNFLDLLPATVSHVICDGQVFLYRHLPRLFGWCYRMEEAHPSRALIRLCCSAVEALTCLIREGGYDAVICVHVFPALALSETVRRFSLHVRTYFVSTDYTCHPFVGETSLSGYFIPHRELIGEFVADGIPAERLLATGIPVHPRFEQKRTRAQVCAELGIAQERRIVLLVGGSIGCGPMRKLAVRLQRDLPPQAMLIVICGTHTHLREQLTAVADRERMRVIGYTDRMSDYMDIADLMLTKAGGLCTTEAIAKRLPMIYIDAVPGCETKNLHFGMRLGYALTAEDPCALSDLTCRCLRTPSMLSLLSETMRHTFPAGSAQAVCRHILAQATQQDRLFG